MQKMHFATHSLTLRARAYADIRCSAGGIWEWINVWI